MVHSNDRSQSSTALAAVAIGLLVGLAGCSSVETLDKRGEEVKKSLKDKGIEVHHGKIVKVMRF